MQAVWLYDLFQGQEVLSWSFAGRVADTLPVSEGFYLIWVEETPASGLTPASETPFLGFLQAGDSVPTVIASGEGAPSSLCAPYPDWVNADSLILDGAGNVLGNAPEDLGCGDVSLGYGWIASNDTGEVWDLRTLSVQWSTEVNPAWEAYLSEGSPYVVSWNGSGYETRALDDGELLGEFPRAGTSEPIPLAYGLFYFTQRAGSGVYDPSAELLCTLPSSVFGRDGFFVDPDGEMWIDAADGRDDWIRLDPTTCDVAERRTLEQISGERESPPNHSPRTQHVTYLERWLVEVGGQSVICTPMGYENVPTYLRDLP